MDAIEIQKPCLLLVEGPDDDGFFRGLAAHLGLQERIQIVQLQGRNNLRGRLKAIRITPVENISELKTLAIALDAEESFANTAHSIRDALTNSGFGVPSQPLQKVTGNPDVIFTILPDDKSDGMLEDLCLQAFSADAILPCLETYLECLNSLSVTMNSKAKIRMILSTKPTAETRLGIAAQKDWWRWDDPAFDAVKSFVQQVAIG